MALLKYLRPLEDLPAPVQEETIAPSPAKKRKRGKYQHFTPEDKATIGRYASEHGVASTVKRFKEKSLKESTVRDWRDLYRKVLSEKAKTAKPGGEVRVTELPSKKRGKPPLLGEKLDGRLQQLILSMRARGVPIGTSVVIGMGRGILLKHNRSQLEEYGGMIKLNKEWAKSILRRMGFTKRKANSKSKVLPTNFEEIKRNYLSDIQAVVEMEDIPPELVINWDHTATKIAASGEWTMEKKEPKE